MSPQYLCLSRPTQYASAVRGPAFGSWLPGGLIGILFVGGVFVGCREAPTAGTPEPLRLATVVVMPTAGAQAAAAPVPKSVTSVEWEAPLRRCSRRGGRRFCDGPRRVPKAAPAEVEWAREVGLGTFQAGAELIRGTPHKSWVDAVAEQVAAPEFPLHWPVAGGRYGRGLQFRGRRITHRGVDITATVGTPVESVAAGVVAYADNSIRGYGNLLLLLHAGGQVSAYAHLSEIRVSLGQHVKPGTVVALAGNTGISRGPHLHFEWREAGRPRDPMPRFPDAIKPAWMQRIARASRR